MSTFIIRIFIDICKFFPIILLFLYESQQLHSVNLPLSQVSVTAVDMNLTLCI